MQIARLLRRDPALAGAVIAVLALSIGVNTAMFSFVNAILLHPLPYRGEERITQVFPAYRSRPDTLMLISLGEYSKWRPALANYFDHLALYHAPGSANLTGAGEPWRVRAAETSPELFSVFGIQPRLGRFFDESGLETGAARPVAVSFNFWRSRLGADQSVIGRTAFLDGEAVRILGVAPPEFDFEEVDLWQPLNLSRYQGEEVATLFCLAGRLKAGLSAAQVEAAVGPLARGQRAEEREVALRVVPLREFLTGASRQFLWLLAGAVGLVLLIACANVAGLLLARAGARRREIAIRLALGADRRRILGLFLRESLALAALGGAAGFLFASWSLDLFKSLAPADLPRLSEVRLDYQALAFTALAAVLAGLLAGILPARAAAEPRPLDFSRDHPGAGRLRQFLVAGEIALSLALLLGAGLLVNTMLRLQRVRLGFDTTSVVSFKTDLPPRGYPDLPSRATFARKALEELGRTPGVSAAGLVNLLPLGGPGSVIILDLPGTSPPPAGPFADKGRPAAQFRIASGGYFRALGIPLLGGRTFTDADVGDRPCAVVINQKLADVFFPGLNPLGHTLNYVDRRNGAVLNACTIVGVAGNVRHWGAAGEEWPEVYFNFDQVPTRIGGWLRSLTFVVRSAGDPAVILPALPRAIRAVDADQPVHSVRTLAELQSRNTARRRFALWLLTFFSIYAVVLALFGIYAVVAHAVARRTREIGIRMALGARPPQVTGLFLRQGALLTASGAACGVLLGLAFTRALRSLLYGVTPADPLTILVALLAVCGASVLATWIPARRAAAVPPASTLRQE